MAERLARRRTKDVAAHEVSVAADVVDDEIVRQRIASGELRPLPKWGDPPVRDHVMAQLRARMNAPRPPKAKAAG
jgi:hypothetical protein